ncbi:MAG: hypothetical protein Q9190_003230 [Brigantiaea leucoxantha]
MASFEGKVIAITGAASGIGEATSHLLASRGATLSLADIQEKNLQSTVDAIVAKDPSTKDRILTRVVNVASSADVNSWLDATISKYGKLDGAANIAGIAGVINRKRIEEIEDEEWDETINVNLKGVFNSVRGELQRMKGPDFRGGSIVNMSSVAGITGHGTGAAYSSSKHGVVGLTKSAAKEVGDRNIRVNAVAPGPILTPLTMNMKLEDIKGDILLALKRFGQTSEVAKLIAFLLSDDSSYITGGVHTIDGGFVA